MTGKVIPFGNHAASIRPVKVVINRLRMDGKKMSKSIFQQIRIRPIGHNDAEKCKALKSYILGCVSDGTHMWVLWQLGDNLFRSSFICGAQLTMEDGERKDIRDLFDQLFIGV